jgi:hypothetical protein
MHDPCWGAGRIMEHRMPMAAVVQAFVLWFEEGRTRPSLALSKISRRFQPWIKPQTAKSASSQGGALATTESVHNQYLNRTEDMNMESLHDR